MPIQCSEEERLFVLLTCVLGYSLTDSYEIAFPKSKAARASMAVRACNLAGERHIQEAFDTVATYDDLHLIIQFSDRRRRR
jgi:hypothetical protein